MVGGLSLGLSSVSEFSETTTSNDGLGGGFENQPGRCYVKSVWLSFGAGLSHAACVCCVCAVCVHGSNASQCERTDAEVHPCRAQGMVVRSAQAKVAQ